MPQLRGEEQKLAWVLGLLRLQIREVRRSASTKAACYPDTHAGNRKGAHPATWEVILCLW